MAARTGSATWNGDLQDGGGRLVVGPDRWESDYDFRSRFTDDAAGSTNPEELLAAAHAGCFTMALTHVLTEAGCVPRSVATSARVRLRPVDGCRPSTSSSSTPRSTWTAWTKPRSRSTPRRPRRAARSPEPWPA